MLFYRVDSEVQAEEFVDEFAKKYACNRGEIKYKITENANPKIFFWKFLIVMHRLMI